MIKRRKGDVVDENDELSSAEGRPGGYRRRVCGPRLEGIAETVAPASQALPASAPANDCGGAETHWRSADEIKTGEAEPLLRRALAIREKALGPDNPNVGNSLLNIAELYQEQGDTARQRRSTGADLGDQRRVCPRRRPDLRTHPLRAPK
jgi:hypothetical protein